MDEGSVPRLVILGFLITMGIFAIFDSPLFSVNQVMGVIGVILLTGVFIYNLKLAKKASDK